MRVRAVTITILIIISGCKTNQDSKVKLNPLSTTKSPGSITEKDVVIKYVNTSVKDIINLSVPKDAFSKPLNFEELVDSYKMIPLETNPNCLIGQIDKIISADFGYIIFDKRNKSIFQFDLTGKFLRRIGNKGDGPQEYNYPYDVSLDESNKEIIVIDLAPRKLLKYSYDGALIESSSMYFLYTQLEKEGNNLICNLGGSYNKNIPLLDEHRLSTYNTKHDTTYTYLPYSRNSNNFAVNRPLRKFNKDIFYYNYFTDTIWEVKNNYLRAFCHINFNGNGWGSKINNVETSHEMEELFKNHWFFNGDYTISDKYLFLKIIKPNWQCMIYYSRQTGNIRLGSGITNTPDRFISMAFNSDPITIDKKNRFISIFEPINILNSKKYIDEDDDKKISNNKLLNTLKMDDNPVLFIYSLKEF